MDLIQTISIILFAIIFLAWMIDNFRKAQLYTNLKPRLDKLESRETGFKNEQATWIRKLEEEKLAIETLAKEKTSGFPWLACAYADYLYLKDKKAADYLEFKPHPAKKAVEITREIAFERKKAERLLRVYKYLLDYLKSLFPFLLDFIGEDIDDLIRKTSDDNVLEETSEDPARNWLTEAEYATLSRIEKYQLALDRYRQKKKSNWEIGRDFERYIGYQYENKGWQVRYQGIIEGFADLGRDIIAYKNDIVHIVQCKYWSVYKTIHEKHIFQLYGSIVAFKIDNPGIKVAGVFITSTTLSERAKKFADELGIIIREQTKLEIYPCIKCNISRKDGTKIYHLPFDQQYDRTTIEEERNEVYAATVYAAESMGFRHALKWRSNN